MVFTMASLTHSEGACFGKRSETLVGPRYVSEKYSPKSHVDLSDARSIGVAALMLVIIANNNNNLVSVTDRELVQCTLPISFNDDSSLSLDHNLRYVSSHHCLAIALRFWPIALTMSFASCLLLDQNAATNPGPGILRHNPYPARTVLVNNYCAAVYINVIHDDDDINKYSVYFRKYYDYPHIWIHRHVPLVAHTNQIL